MFQRNIGMDPNSITHVVGFLDAESLHHISLERLVQRLGCPSRHCLFHKNGNDAHYIMRAFLMLVTRMAREAAPAERSPKNSMVSELAVTFASSHPEELQQ